MNSPGRWFARGVVAALRRLSWRQLAALSRGLAAVVFALGIRRRVTLDNLRQAFPKKPEPELRRIARAAYANMGLCLLEALSFSARSKEEQLTLMDVGDWSPVERALAQNKGLLIATCHLGSWEVMGEVLIARGLPLNAVAYPLKGAFNEQILEARLKVGMRIIEPKGAIQGMRAAIERGEAVAQLVDQAVNKRGVFVPFFGRLASTTPALSLVAQRTGAPVLAMFPVREGGRLRLYIEGPVEVPHTGDDARDLEAHVRALTELVERYVRRYPEQWLWLHRRWKVAPPPPAELAVPATS